MLLRRVAGAPSVRKVIGDALEPLTEAAASGLDLDFLYAQGYLAQGDWARPAVAETLHAGR